ncbi:glycine-rich rna-binding protein 4 [Quercus suber]|uniref:Glycine-rich rna-binding protein 4 n=1 Tax=Quercus suber TaxID=58331 RepID=A0AAW0L9Z1_QUESU
MLSYLSFSSKSRWTNSTGSLSLSGLNLAGVDYVISPQVHPKLMNRGLLGTWNSSLNLAGVDYVISPQVHPKLMNRGLLGTWNHATLDKKRLRCHYHFSKRTKKLREKDRHGSEIARTTPWNQLHNLGISDCAPLIYLGELKCPLHAAFGLAKDAFSDTDEAVLKDAFGQPSEIIEGNVMTLDLPEGIVLSYLAIKTVCDHINRRSKGHGLVQFASKTMVSTALKEMDGQGLDGRNIRVYYAHKDNNLDLGYSQFQS